MSFKTFPTFFTLFAVATAFDYCGTAEVPADLLCRDFAVAYNTAVCDQNNTAAALAYSDYVRCIATSVRPIAEIPAPIPYDRALSLKGRSLFKTDWCATRVHPGDDCTVEAQSYADTQCVLDQNHGDNPVHHFKEFGEAATAYKLCINNCRTSL